jgi:hypothetical protein
MSNYAEENFCEVLLIGRTERNLPDVAVGRIRIGGAGIGKSTLERRLAVTLRPAAVDLD